VERPRAGRTLPEARDTYWDPHLSRINLAEPNFGNLAHVTGLSKQLGAGRIIITAEDDDEIRRYLLQKARVVGPKVFLELGRPDHNPTARPLRVGQAVRMSWSHDGCWWGCHVHVTEASQVSLVLDFPRTVYRFPVREQLWGNVSAMARMFEGFDVTLSDVTDAQPVNHRNRVTEILTAAIEQARPCLIFLLTPGTFFPGQLQATAGTNPRDVMRPPRTIDIQLVGTDMVGVGWRAGQPVAVSVVVNGLTIGFRTKTQGGQDARLTLAWPETLQRRQRRKVQRCAVGAKEMVDFRIPIVDSLGLSRGDARPFRVVDIGPGGASLIFDEPTANSLGSMLRDAEITLYGRLTQTVALEVVGRVPFGNGYVRFCCAFRGLEAKQERALEVLCQKLQGLTQ
jgi:hypothetical protein